MSATESLRRQHHLSPIPINVACSLVALLVLLASILLTVLSLFLFHEIPFYEFDCFPCNFSKNHFALKENLFTRLVTLASWPQKANIEESGLNSGMRGTTVHWNKPMHFLNSI